MEKWKLLASVLLGFAVSFTHQYALMIVMVLFALGFDFVTGLVKAEIYSEVSSSIGTKGFFKKVSLLVCLFFGFFLDYSIPYFLINLGMDMKFQTPFGMIMCFYIVLNECISICENLYLCNPNIMPKWIVKFLKTAKESLEKEEGSNNEGTEEE